MKNKNYDILVQYILDGQDKFYRLAFSYTHTKEGALDVVQNAICKALESYGTIRNMQYIRTWFYKVLVNESLIYLKKNQREVLSDDGIFTELPYLEPAYTEDNDLYEQVEKLSLEIKTIVKLHYYEGFSLPEIAEITATNVNTVKSRLYAGLRKLKKEIKEESL